MVWTRTHESLDIYCFGLGWSGHICLRTHEERTKNFERTKVWTYPLSVWDGLDIGTLSLGRSGHRHFPSGPVWTYPLWVWDLSLGKDVLARSLTYKTQVDAECKNVRKFFTKYENYIIFATNCCFK